MAYISLYRKYRPLTFDDVVGQKIVVKILKNSIINDKINHAYIFSGPRGTGKTTIAKIFAKAVKCLNKCGDVCNNCDVCKMNFDESIDLVEIDAASNNGIDEIREIKNNIKLLPSILKYKVYIIDEVHMLSNSAFNALLKTLEEPPSHAIFILATTELNKIPVTVLSRCQKFDFKKIDDDDIINRLKYICEKENIFISDDILKYITELSDGCMRDAINLLDQVNSINKEEITRTDVLNLIGGIDNDVILKLLDYIVSCDIPNVIKLINNLNKTNKNFVNVVQSLLNVVKDIIIFNSTSDYFDKEYEDKLYKYSKLDVSKLIEISQDLFNLINNLKKSNNQMVLSEIIFIKITLYFKKNEESINIHSDRDNTENKNVNKEYIEIKEDNSEISQDEKNILINNTLCGADKKLKKEFIDNFDKINDYLTQKEYNSVANLLKKSVPEVVSDKYLLFTFNKNFEVVLFDKNIDLIIKFIKHLYGKKYNVVAITQEEWEKVKNKYIKDIKSGIKYEYIDINNKKDKIKKKNTELENSIENIFGEEYKIEE